MNPLEQTFFDILGIILGSILIGTYTNRVVAVGICLIALILYNYLLMILQIVENVLPVG